MKSVLIPGLWLTAALALSAAEVEVGGVGIALAVDKETKEFSIARIVPDSPAAKAGLVTGMVIHRVNGSPAGGKKLEEMIQLIRGPVGSSVLFELIEPRSRTTNKTELVRATIAGLPKAPGSGRLGDPAAPLKISEWIKGGPVELGRRDKIYVVEFWATWCGPCRVSIPHLTEMQKRFAAKGVVFVGVSDEKPAVVKPFVEKMGAKMDYAIACDDQRQTFSGYMDAYGRGGIPSAFVVDREGKVVWAGHPMAGLEAKLKEITDKL